jgi:hypothetical protein
MEVNWFFLDMLVAAFEGAIGFMAETVKRVFLMPSKLLESDCIFKVL